MTTRKPSETSEAKKVSNESAADLSKTDSEKSETKNFEIGEPSVNQAHLEALGWRQGSLLDKKFVSMPAKFNDNSPPYVLVCSQSCTVVSGDFGRDPIVELVCGTPIPAYHAKSYEAKGKNQRTLHLQMDGLKGYSGLSISINSKFEIGRDTILNLYPADDFSLAPEEVTKLSNWLGRNYTRIAIPTRLVTILEKVFLPELKAWLGMEAAGGLGKVSGNVEAIYIQWEENTDTGVYHMKFIFTCEENCIEESFDLHFAPKVATLTENNDTGVLLEVLTCKLKTQTFLSDLDGYARYSEYDYLTSMEEWHTLQTPE